MPTAHLPDPPYLQRLPDGTIKQLNAFTGTQVWTVPGRGNRPLGLPDSRPRPVTAAEARRLCAFCCDRLLETPPEKARVVRAGAAYEILRDVPAAALHDTVAELRRIPNLFEILSFDYWVANYDYRLPEATARRRDEYLADPVGREHLLAVCRAKALASGRSADEWDALSERERLAGASGFFGGGHDVIVARRHLLDGATDTSQLASSGTLTPDEHAAYVDLTVEAMRDLYDANRSVRYVAAFQNWLKAAGASFDHLHKQVVAIDSRGTEADLVLSRVRANPGLVNEGGVDYAAQQGLIVADNEHAVAFAGFGHRYPTLEVWSRSATCEPWRQTDVERRAMSDLLHALHAATGPEVPCNEEWHHRPIGVDVPMPWRVLIKWRVSTLAGFEGGTKVYVNTISPWALRDRVAPRLAELRDQGRLAPGTRLGDECDWRPGTVQAHP